MNSMRILIPHESGGNLYIRELARAYEAFGHNVVLGRENFLYLNSTYDIVHVHWPEWLYRIPNEGRSEHENVIFVLDRLEFFKKRGAKCVFTIHNLKPHENGDTEHARRIYQGIFDMADLIVHHCEKSVELARSRYGNCDKKKFIVAPHGNYFGYPANLSRQKAREELGLKKDDFVFLHFGLIRAYKGLDRVIKAFKGSRVKNKKLIIAGSLLGWPPLKKRLQYKWYKVTRHFNGKILLFLRTIPNSEVQLFLKACDAVVLGHTSGLNSGVAILGMSFGRIVIGPDIGCIGEVLRQGQNVVYEVSTLANLTKALEEATLIQPEQAQKVNFEMAKKWTWENMAKRILEQLSCPDCSI